MADPIYLDYNATAPLRPAAKAAMEAVLGPPANASSVHGFGRAARAQVEEARESLAGVLGCEPGEIVFTGGGSEANNAALHQAPTNSTLVSMGEHDSVLNAARGALPISLGEDGVVDMAALEVAVKKTEPPFLVSVMLANNETGVIQPIAKIAELVHERGGLLHCDAVQAVGKIAVDIEALGADYVSLSAHKLGGPQGVGALVVRDGLAFEPLIKGGGQERRRRAGTENVAGIVGFAAAAEEAAGALFQLADQADWHARLAERIADAAPDARVFGKDAPRLPNTSCISLPGVSAETQIMALDLAGIAVSAGSACSSGKVTPSHVLKAMGASESEAGAAIRVSTGWASEESDLDHLYEVWQDLLAKRSAA